MMTDAELYKIAEDAAKGAYAPYSGYKVGAALLTKDGGVYTGVNIENSSYGASICAERTAAVKAISEGHRSFAALAVAAPETGEPSWPCGICRQFLFEFGGDIRVITGKNADTIEVHHLDELILKGFVLKNGKVNDD